MQRIAQGIGVLIWSMVAGMLWAGDGPACGACHAAVDAGHHGTADVPCVACHGAATDHWQNPAQPGSVTRFAAEPVASRDAVCAGCHSDSHPVGGSRHQQAGVACHECHASHPDQSSQTDQPSRAGLGRMDAASTMCANCHADSLAAFRLNERHRLLEGAISCTDCHEPHGADQTTHLGGGASAPCAQCHPRTAGPFVFEHGAQQVEGCGACHDPHGSPNRHLLKQQRVGDLCYGCHVSVPQFHLGFSPVGPPRFGGSTVCTNCHVTIHGSNIDPGFLR